MDKVIGMAYFFNVWYTKGTYACQTHVCLNWKISLNELVLICKVDSLNLKVIIADQYGNTQADCLPPRPFSKCDPYYKNGSISQNPKTNETIYIVKGKIDTHINGIWTCRHGTRRDVAYVEVTVLEIPDSQTAIDCFNNSSQHCKHNTYTQDENCIRNSLINGTISVLASIVICLSIIPFFKTQFKSEVDCFRRRSNCPCINLTQQEKILVCKRLVFAVSTIIVLSFFVLLGWFDDKSCTSQWVVIGIGIIFGLINAIFLLQNTGFNKNKEEGQQHTSMSDVSPSMVEGHQQSLMTSISVNEEGQEHDH